ncbi:RING/U-box superfamily protein [Melia azedarach]|uniref:RING/U-box superfamily protein n=1 Tax=Melia azedarach TaxID=155640 RepID=A0ACC1YKW8_MELAZ|nr:RING/U-box superfamily protein [Melia azedarach]
MEVTMNAFEIAASKAELLLRLGNWSTYSTSDNDEQLEFGRLEWMTEKLAMSRALASNKDYKTVLMEVELEVSIHLAKLLEPTIDPALTGTRSLKVEEDGMVCGVCQEEMEKGEEGRAMDCMHTFHDACILKWLKIKNTCPLCRTTCKPKKLEFQDLEI